MEDQEKNMSNHSAMPDRKAITLRLSYFPNLKHELADAVDFVMEKLKFYPTEKFNPTSELTQELIVLKNQNGDLLELNIQLVEPNAESKHITFYTDDCLRDYYKYLKAGVKFVSRPEYSNLGLCVDFIGHKDARYSLLEERTYTDS